MLFLLLLLFFRDIIAHSENHYNAGNFNISLRKNHRCHFQTAVEI